MDNREKIDSTNEFEALVDEFIIGEGFSIAEEKKPEPSKKNKKKKYRALKSAIWVLGIIVLSVLLSLGIIYGASDFLGIGGNRGNEYTVEIPEGSSLSDTAKILHENKIIDSKLLFKLYSKVKGYDKRYQTGVFILSDEDGYAGIATKLVHVGEKITTVTVRIPEMATVDDIINLLAENNVGNKSELKNAIQNGEFKYSFVEKIPEKSVHWRFEGYLFPDTYEFYNFDEPEKCAELAIDKLLGTMDSRFTEDMKKQGEELGYSMHEILTMASIIELEAGGASFEDKQKVAEIFYNRLEDWGDSALLQSNPTRKYPYGNGAYNTYERAGLPVGPLCSPSMESIKAALDPSTSQPDYYYFITDKNMKFYYNKTLTAHINTQNRLMREGNYAG
ncbi:MAG: endolytic transglycosylase MltG [Clostridia bacterium]|nr:endolytic transglycosylase MltG [Clostridia bacterium]